MAQKIGALDPKAYLTIATPAPSDEDVAEVVMDSQVEEAKAALAQEAQNVVQSEQKGSIPYGRLVMACGRCVDAGLTRAQIGSILAQHLEPQTKVKRVITNAGESLVSSKDKGRGARYIFLMRVEKGDYLAGETPVTQGIVVNGQTFTKPVTALMAGVASFTKIYNEFRSLVRPPVQDFTKVAEDPVQAIQNAVPNIGFRVKVKDPKGGEWFTTLKVTQPMAFVAAMHGLLRLEVAHKMLPKSQRDALVKVLDQAVGVIPSQAKSFSVLKGGKAA